MKLLPLLLLGLFSCGLAAAEARWADLFDGRTLQGWKKVQGDARFEVRDGTIVGTVTEGVPMNTFLITDGEYGDFILECEFKADAGINSGIQFRSRPADEKVKRVHGYQFEIDPTPRALTGGLYIEGVRWLAPEKNNGEPREAWNRRHGDKFKPGAWNQVRIEVRGNRVQSWLNGYQLVDYTDAAPDRIARGFIGLQVHSTRNAELFGKQVAFRKLRIQVLDR